MKQARYFTVLVAAVSCACGGDAPEPPQGEAPPAQEGVSGMAPETTLGVPSVVTLSPSSGGTSSPTSEVAVMDQLGLAFLPPQLLVHVGQPLLFTNSESLAHNVHVVFIDSDSTVYIADMDPGSRAQIVLELEGGYDVTCDVHPGMRAFIYATSAPYAALADPDGRFFIADVPPGSYTASVWSASAELRGERAIEVFGSMTDLDLSTP